MASGSEPLLVDLVRRHGLLLLAAGEHARLRDVAARLRPEVLTGDPMLALLAATANLEIGELDTAERLLAAAGARLARRSRPGAGRAAPGRRRPP